MIFALKNAILASRRPSVLRQLCHLEAPTAKAEESVKKHEANGPLFIAAHVGSGFCRAAAMTSKGTLLRLAEVTLPLHETGIFVEMSSEKAWKSLVKCIKRISERVKGHEIKGIGFTAIRALVCLDANGNPVTVSASRDPNLNVILHFDHRSTRETKKINDTRHALLRYFGDHVLPDLHESKLLWLKNNLKGDSFDKAEQVFDLTDFLTWKATGSAVRSTSTLVTQWTYEMSIGGHEGWNADYLKEIGIPELAEENFKRIGPKAQPPGTPLGEGILENVAQEMGLKPGTVVATGMPDSIAGCLGLIGCNFKGVADDLTNRLCIVFGTRAASHFILSREPKLIKGVNGPFRDSVLPHMWLNHAGQTATESALEYIIDGHPATKEIRKQVTEMHIHKYLNKILKLKAQKNNLPARSYLTKNIHLVSDFDGNKSPLSDSTIRGMISGLSIPAGQENLALLYLATLQSLAYSTKHIISALSQQGHDIRCILMGGGLSRNSLFANLHRDVCQVPTVTPSEPKSKLLGAAILAAVASNHYSDFNHAIHEMGGTGHVIKPQTEPELIEYHEKKYQVFLKMYDHQMEYRRIMSGGSKDFKMTDAKEQ